MSKATRVRHWDLLDKLLADADEVAEWAAEHPDDVPTAEWAFT